MARVLAVDDDPVIVQLLRVNLELEGYDVDVAADGDEALEVARATRPDLILLDVMMPKRDGLSVCEELRRDPHFAATPIVILSARAQAADVARGRDVGATTYITKPFDPVDLLELVAGLLDR